MRKLLHRITLLLAVISGVGLTACSLDDDDNSTGSPNCVILSFSVADISSAVPGKTAAGKDTTYTRVIESEDIYFNIDQLNNRITSVDSLPSWVDLTHVIPTVSYAGYIYRRLATDSLFYAFTSGSDSTDFSQPVRFLVRSTDGTDARIYTVEIFKSSEDADSLYWTQMPDGAMPALGEHRVVERDGVLYAYAATDSGCVVTTGTSTSAGTLSWSGLRLTTGPSAPRSETVCRFQSLLYALDTDGQLLVSADGTAWERVADVNGTSLPAFSRLLCADDDRLYATQGDSLLVATRDLAEWQATASTDLLLLPQAPVQSAAYATKTNTQLSNVVMLGLNDRATGHAVAWYKVSADDDELDQDWAYIRITDDNAYPMPALDGLRMVRYAGYLYAIGSPYNRFYRSADNGITWHSQEANALPPVALQGDADAQVCLSTANDYLWLTTGDGRVWRGHIR